MASKQTALAALIILWLPLLTVDAAAINGNEWKQLPRSSRDAYIWGVTDTWKNLADAVTLRQRGLSQPVRSPVHEPCALFTTGNDLWADQCNRREVHGGQSI